jgi:hypothetical protein
MWPFQMPGRKFPGIFMQGDTFAAMVTLHHNGHTVAMRVGGNNRGMSGPVSMAPLKVTVCLQAMCRYWSTMLGRLIFHGRAAV